MGRSWLRTALAEAGGLVLPVECAGCGRWDVALCPACRELLRAAPRRCEHDAPLLADGPPTWSLGPYRGALRSVVLGWKTHRRLDIAPAVLAAAEGAGRTWTQDPGFGAVLAMAAHPDDAPRHPAGRDARGCDVVVVPAPSGWRRRAAGRFVVGDLADAVGRGLAAGLGAAPTGSEGPAPRRVVVADLLRRRGGAAHQTGSGVRSRAANRRDRVTVLAAPPAGAPVVLVDDVVTTGATLVACAAELSAHGASVVAAFVLASTPRPGRVPRVPGGPVRTPAGWTHTGLDAAPAAGMPTGTE